MTNKEAIDWLNCLKEIHEDDISDALGTWYKNIKNDHNEVIDMAIEALEAQNGDAISRQQAIDIVQGYAEQLQGYIGMPNDSEVYAYARGLLLSIDRNIKALPSAQPEVIRCKDCKYYSHPWHCEAWNNSPGFPAVSDEMFCSMAERRIDGTD